MKKVIFSLIATIAIISSCKKDVLQDSSTTQTSSLKSETTNCTLADLVSSIGNENGTLVFKDEAHLKKVVTCLKNLNNAYNAEQLEVAKSKNQDELKKMSEEGVFNNVKIYQDFEKALNFFSYRQRLESEDLAYMQSEQGAKDENLSGLPSGNSPIILDHINVLLDRNGEIIMGDKKANVLTNSENNQLKSSCFWDQKAREGRVGRDYLCKIHLGFERIGWPFAIVEAYSTITSYRLGSGWFGFGTRWKSTNLYLGTNNGGSHYDDKCRLMDSYPLSGSSLYGSRCQVSGTYWWKTVYTKRGEYAGDFSASGFPGGLTFYRQLSL